MRWIFSIIIEALQCSRGQKVRRCPRSWKPVQCHHNVPGGVQVAAWDENLWVLCTSREAWMSWVWLCKWLCCKCTGSGGGLAIWCDLLWHCWHRWRANSLQIVLGFLETLLEFFWISVLWQLLAAKEKTMGLVFSYCKPFKTWQTNKSIFWRPHIFCGWILKSVSQWPRVQGLFPIGSDFSSLCCGKLGVGRGRARDQPSPVKSHLPAHLGGVHLPSRVNPTVCPPSSR